MSEGWSRSYEGTGLGLTIAKRFTDLLKGEISVESKLNSGSTFSVRIPLTGITNKIREDINEEKEIKNEVIKKTGKDFLLIDDDKFVNDIVSNIFHSEAYSYANNQEDALALLGSKQFSLILAARLCAKLLLTGSSVKTMHLLCFFTLSKTRFSSKGASVLRSMISI